MRIIWIWGSKFVFPGSKKVIGLLSFKKWVKTIIIELSFSHYSGLKYLNPPVMVFLASMRPLYACRVLKT